LAPKFLVGFELLVIELSHSGKGENKNMKALVFSVAKPEDRE
jgi:hypothetical protein